ncbi:MAG: energy-coupling factor transporter transmembrane component T [Sporomusaceae bacterium]|nr:energy-coupling factor transporter transmembrane component T [Sporomusaceae bacterium]
MEPRIITKFCLTLAMTVWAIVLTDPLYLGGLVLAELVLLAAVGLFGDGKKVLGSLVLFALFLGALQLLCGASYALALLSGLRMLAMTFIFVYLLKTTTSSEFHQLFTETFRLAPEYAFMLTSVFRFIPDFVKESKQVREAQSCRGYQEKSSVLARLAAYGALIGPLVLRAISRSENMAMALALRGFAAKKTEKGPVLHRIDYGFFSGIVLASALIFYIH